MGVYPEQYGVRFIEYIRFIQNLYQMHQHVFF